MYFKNKDSFSDTQKLKGFVTVRSASEKNVKPLKVEEKQYKVKIWIYIKNKEYQKWQLMGEYIGLLL